MTALNDRAHYCIIKPGCPGPSFLVQTGMDSGAVKNTDKWECAHCRGYILVLQDDVPAQPRQDHVSSR